MGRAHTGCRWLEVYELPKIVIDRTPLWTAVAWRCEGLPVFGHRGQAVRKVRGFYINAGQPPTAGFGARPDDMA